MCRSMVDIQSATAVIRRGKKKKIETVQKYNFRICYLERPYVKGCSSAQDHTLQDHTDQTYVHSDYSQLKIAILGRFLQDKVRPKTAGNTCKLPLIVIIAHSVKLTLLRTTAVADFGPEMEIPLVVRMPKRQQVIFAR